MLKWVFQPQRSIRLILAMSINLANPVSVNLTVQGGSWARVRRRREDQKKSGGLECGSSLRLLASRNRSLVWHSSSDPGLANMDLTSIQA